MWKAKGGRRIIPEIHIRDNTPAYQTSLEEKCKQSRIINGKKTIGTLNISNQDINSLIKWKVYYINDLLSKTKSELLLMKIEADIIKEIESILQLHNPNFDGFK